MNIICSYFSGFNGGEHHLLRCRRRPSPAPTTRSASAAKQARTVVASTRRRVFCEQAGFFFPRAALIFLSKCFCVIKLFIHHPFPEWWVPLLCDLHMRVNLTYTSVDRRGCSRIETRSNVRVELIIIEYINIIVNTLAEGEIIIKYMYH